MSAPRGITANLVAPGRIDTDRSKTGAPHPSHHAHHSSPLGIQGSTEDVTAMIRHLAGPSGGYITGRRFRWEHFLIRLGLKRG